MNEEEIYEAMNICKNMINNKDIAKSIDEGLKILKQEPSFIFNPEEIKAIDYLQLCYDVSTIDIESIPKLGIALNLIDKLQKDIKEWFDIADNILRATDKYGEISIGEVADYISKLQKENKELSEKMVDKICKGIEEEVLEEYREKINKLQKELDKKDKVINLMVRELALPGISIERMDLYSKVSPDKPIWNLIKEYFYKKVEEEND